MKSALKKSKMSSNVSSNIFVRLWNMFSIYMFIPLYIKFLGEELYGLITFFVVLQTVMSLLGLGLSKTLRREFASGDNSNENKVIKYQMLRSVELVYIVVSLLIVIICFLGSNFIATEWLNIGSLDASLVELTLQLMGISIAIQLVANLYSGCLFGLEKQVLANNYLIGWSLAKNFGVILLLWLIDGNIILFYSWHIVTDILYLFILRIVVVNQLKCNTPLSWKFSNISNLKKIRKFALGLVLVSIIYTLNTQLDKIIISKYLSLTELSAYTLVFLLGNLTSIIATAIATAAFSRLTLYFTTNNLSKHTESFISFNKVAAITIIVIGTFVATYSYELVFVWTGNEIIAELIKGAGFFIVLGSTFASLQIMPYEYMLSRGDTKVNNILGFSSIPFILIITPFFVINYGIFGAAMSWFILMTVSTLVYIFYIHRTYIGRNTVHWMISETLLPLLISLSLAFASKYLISLFDLSLLFTLIYGIISGTIVLIIILTLFNNVLKDYFLLRYSKFF